MGLCNSETSSGELMGGEYNRFTVLDAIKSSKQKALSAKTIILSDSQGHATTIKIGIRYTLRL